MDPIVVVFVLVNAIALMIVPRKWALLPLIAGSCLMTRGQAIELGVATLTVVRILVAVGILRVIARREWAGVGFNALDGLMLVWGLWMIATAPFHAAHDTSFVLRVRDVYEAWGLYFLFRVFCRSVEDVRQVTKILAPTLASIAVMMVLEKATGVNFFSRFGDVPQYSVVRNGVVRAQGPFAHAILAGSIGAVCIPLVVGLWNKHRALALLGIGACAAIVLASGSSGPILAVGAGLAGMMLWPLRDRMRLVRLGAVMAYVGLEILMNRPAYVSTGWHRAELVRVAFAHVVVCWLVGTDYTRHWMASGVLSSPNHVDITNHFIGMGVVGGLPLMMLFVAFFVKGFSYVGQGLRADTTQQFYPWVVGVSLFAHLMTCLSVSYFDHSVMFLYLTLAASVGVSAVPVQVGQQVVPSQPVQSRWVRRGMYGSRSSGRSAAWARLRSDAVK
jgi:hypothetical protein